MGIFVSLIKDALIELFAKKLRTFLTLLGMIFGVGAVIAMLNIGEGAQREALQMINAMGANNLIIKQKDSEQEQLQELRQESLGLTMNDVDAALQTLPFINGFSALKTIHIHNIYSDYGKFNGEAVGVSVSYFEQANLVLAKGREFTVQDEISLSQVAILGADAAHALFDNSNIEPLGQLVKINHLWVNVIGVIQAQATEQTEFQGVAIGGDQFRVFLPISTAEQKLKQERLASQLDEVKFGVSEGYDPRVAALAIERLLSKRHGDTSDYELIVPAALLEQQAQTQAIFNIVMASVAGISLLVGGIGIMNIMLANVLERTKEIGLLRAIGATQKDIKLQFLAESFTISVLGGVIGVLFGLGLSEIIAFYSGWAVTWSLFAIVLSLGICLLVGVGFGVFPAIKASKLNPIEALHTD